MKITTVEEYEAALREVEPYFDDEPEVGSPQAIRFIALCDAIEAYENVYYPIAPPSSAYPRQS